MTSIFLNKTKLITLFQELGVCKGDILLIHTSMHKLGHVIGGAQTLVDALLEVVGDNGTIVAPYQRTLNTYPYDWCYPALDFDEIKDYHQNFPAYDKFASVDYKMGRMVENMRLRKQAVISDHPIDALIAIGHFANYICNYHPLDFSLGIQSPLFKLLQVKAKTLLIGVDYTSSTIMHLGEYCSETLPIIVESPMLKINKQNTRYRFLDYDLNSDEFNYIGNAMEKKEMVRSKCFNSCSLKLYCCKDAVLESIEYFKKKLKYYKE